jgi:hypothetical protein
MTKTGRKQRLVVVAVVLTGLAGAIVPVAGAATPVNATKPSITGEVKEGQTLTARNGTWQNAPTSFRYRWQRCDVDGTACVNLVGEMQRTYPLDANDVGKTVRVLVTATNADGSATATSDPTARIVSSSGPRNTARPTISGTLRVGEELTADPGMWTGAPDRIGMQWQRCESDGNGCADVTGATGRTYGVRSADVRKRLRVVVSATNSAGTATATSDLTSVVATPMVPVARNQRPRVVIVGARLLGARVYARFRVCDDSRKNVTIIQTDARPGVPSFTRRFATLRPPLRCGLYSRTWKPAQRFRTDGRYVLILRARDKSGLMSLPVRRVFFR